MEIVSDWPNKFIPKIIEKLKTRPILIFCGASLETTLRRNRERSRVVPEEILKNQAKFNCDFYKNLSSDLGIKLIIIDCGKSSVHSYPDLKKKLKL